jgi:hypothetical protein
MARVLDQHRAGAVDDLAARRGEVELAHLVLVGLGDVVVGVQHLQRP